MSRSGEIRLQFGAQEHLFRLGIDQLVKMEEECGAGTPEILASLAPLVAGLKGGMTLGDMLLHGRLGAWKTIYMRSIHFWGLVGAGELSRTQAGALVTQEFDASPSFEFAASAFMILQAAWSGSEVESLGEKNGAAAKKAKPKPRSQAARPAGPSTTA